MKGDFNILKAFDTILQAEVSATLAAQSGGFEQYRYECACCGEEVYVAAPFSTKQVAHFRHRNGNNDVECENYLGQFGILKFSTDAYSRKGNRERAECYFDYSNKTFCIGLRFSENEIKSYEDQVVDFELRTKDSDKPIRSLKINSHNFTPDVPTMIPLNAFSYSYNLSNTCNGSKRKYDLFNRKMPTFFKILGNDENFKAKHVRSTFLYTNTRYFVAIQSQYEVYRAFNGIEISDTFYFDTMGHRFAGIVLKILKKTSQVDNLINSWGYQLESSEKLSLIWPPASINDEVTEIDAEFVFMYTSFTLQAHGNINLHAEDIVQLPVGISKVAVKEKTKVFLKNVEIVIKKIERRLLPLVKITVLQEMVDEFTAPEDSNYFIFNRSGATPLSKGQSVQLTPQSTIKHFLSGYLRKEIVPLQHQLISGHQLLIDILSHCKQSEEFDVKLFSSLSLSDTALKYILECETAGLINLVARRYILDGKL